MHRGLLFADGWSTEGEQVPVISPATGEQVGSYIAATIADVDRAADEADSLGREWSRMSAGDRCVVLKKAAALVRENADDIARVLTVEQGKTVPDSMKEITFGASVLEYYAEESLRVFGSIRPASAPNTVSIVNYEPVGIVAGIVPWNYPVDLYFWKVAPALAAGCPVIVKPPVEAPLAIGMVSGLLREAGVPAGALSDLPGGADVGQALVAAPQVRMVTATCSSAAGKAIMATAAQTLTHVSLELGGQCPFIVLPDADLKTAAKEAARRSFSNMGQICIAVNRIIVDESVADEFVQELVSVVSSYAVGDPLDPAIGYGPCTTGAVVEKVEEHIADAVAHGGTVVHGGQRPSDPALQGGHYFIPTVIDHVPVDAKMMTEESFGPVVAVHRVTTVGDAIEVANGVDYGLAAYVYGEDTERAYNVAEQIDAGGVGVNVNDVSELLAPFGGRKQSGIGRELGAEGLYAFLESKHIKVRRKMR